MIIVGGEFRVNPDERDEFVQSRRELVRRSRGEPGCIEYAISADPVEPDRVVLFECWASRDALADHLHTIERPNSIRPASSAIMLYDVSEARPYEGPANLGEHP